MRSTILLLSTALASSVVAVPSLRLALSSPPIVPDDDVRAIKVNITNTGREPVELIQTPDSLLSESPTDKFAIRGAAGTPEFIGFPAKYSTDPTLQPRNTPNSVTLQPGKSLEVVHNLTCVYDFSESGTGVYTVTAKKDLPYRDTSGNTVMTTTKTEPLVLTITNRTLVAKKTCPPLPRPGLVRRGGISFTGCTSDQEKQIMVAAQIADQYVANATRFLNEQVNVTHAPKSYETWFGQFDPWNFEAVKSIYEHIGTDATSSFYDCNCKDGSLVAWVEAHTPRDVNICPRFWTRSREGMDSQAGTLVQQQTHFLENGGAVNVVHGADMSRLLAKQKPRQAVTNGDNYEYFVESRPWER